MNCAKRALGATDLLCVYIGDQLGLYTALVREGPSTSAELASVAGFNERCAREWGTAGNGRHLETERQSGAGDGKNPQKVFAIERGGHAMLAAAALIADLIRG